MSGRVKLVHFILLISFAWNPAAFADYGKPKCTKLAEEVASEVAADESAGNSPRYTPDSEGKFSEKVASLIVDRLLRRIGKQTDNELKGREIFQKLSALALPLVAQKVRENYPKYQAYDKLPAGKRGNMKKDLNSRIAEEIIDSLPLNRVFWTELAPELNDTFDTLKGDAAALFDESAPAVELRIRTRLKKSISDPEKLEQVLREKMVDARKPIVEAIRSEIETHGRLQATADAKNQRNRIAMYVERRLSLDESEWRARAPSLTKFYDGLDEVRQKIMAEFAPELVRRIEIRAGRPSKKREDQLTLFKIIAKNVERPLRFYLNQHAVMVDLPQNSEARAERIEQAVRFVLSYEAIYRGDLLPGLRKFMESLTPAQTEIFVMAASALDMEIGRRATYNSNDPEIQQDLLREYLLQSQEPLLELINREVLNPSEDSVEIRSRRIIRDLFQRMPNLSFRFIWPEPLRIARANLTEVEQRIFDRAAKRLLNHLNVQADWVANPAEDFSQKVETMANLLSKAVKINVANLEQGSTMLNVQNLVVEKVLNQMPLSENELAQVPKSLRDVGEYFEDNPDADRIYQTQLPFLVRRIVRRSALATTTIEEQRQMANRLLTRVAPIFQSAIKNDLKLKVGPARHGYTVLPSTFRQLSLDKLESDEISKMLVRLRNNLSPAEKLIFDRVSEELVSALKKKMLEVVETGDDWSEESLLNTASETLELAMVREESNRPAIEEVSKKKSSKRKKKKEVEVVVEPDEHEDFGTDETSLGDFQSMLASGQVTSNDTYDWRMVMNMMSILGKSEWSRVASNPRSVVQDPVTLFLNDIRHGLLLPIETKIFYETVERNEQGILNKLKEYFNIEVTDFENLSQAKKKQAIDAVIDQVFDSELKIKKADLSKRDQKRWREIAKLVKDNREIYASLIRNNLRLVVAVARDFRSHVPFLDRAQAGVVGLINAVYGFDYHRGLQFSTYATTSIFNQIINDISENWNQHSISDEVRKRWGSIYFFKREFFLKNGRKPTVEEIVEALTDNGVTEDDYSLFERTWGSLLSLDKPVGEKQEYTLVSFIKDDSTAQASTEVQIEELKKLSTELRFDISKYLDQLSQPDGKIILQKLFGLDGEEPMSAVQVADLLDKSSVSVRSTRDAAIREIRVLFFMEKNKLTEDEQRVLRKRYSLLEPASAVSISSALSMDIEVVEKIVKNLEDRIDDFYSMPSDAPSFHQ